jgi:hypothetical protein
LISSVFQNQPDNIKNHTYNNNRAYDSRKFEEVLFGLRYFKNFKPDPSRFIVFDFFELSIRPFVVERACELKDNYNANRYVKFISNHVPRYLSVILVQPTLKYTQLPLRIFSPTHVK